MVLLGACAAPSEDLSQQDSAVDSSLRAAARASQEVRNYSGAVAHYASLYERNPDDMEIVLGYARNLRYLGDVERAVAVLAKALETQPDDPALLAEYGRALLAADRPADALVPLQRVADADAADWRIRSAIGIAHDLLDQPELAVAAYQDALAIEPNNPIVLNNLALSQTMAGDVEAGVATLRRAILNVKAGVQERQNLAVLLALSGRLDEAERLIEADLPREMARANIAYVRRLAAARDEGATAPEVLESLPVLTNLPKLAPVPVTSMVVEPVEPVASELASTTEEDTFAAAAADAADEAFASLTGQTTAATTTEDTATAASGGARLYGAQLAAYSSEADATAGRTTLTTSLGSGDYDLRVVAVTRADGTTIYRVYAGPFSSVEDARSVCATVRTTGLSCLVSPAP